MVSKSKSKNLRRNIKQPIFCRLATKSASGVKYEGNPPETIKTIERLTRAVVNNYNKGQRWFIISLSVANWKIDSLFEDYDDDDKRSHQFAIAIPSEDAPKKEKIIIFDHNTPKNKKIPHFDGYDQFLFLLSEILGRKLTFDKVYRDDIYKDKEYTKCLKNGDAACNTYIELMDDYGYFSKLYVKNKKYYSQTANVNLEYY